MPAVEQHKREVVIHQFSNGRIIHQCGCTNDPVHALTSERFDPFAHRPHASVDVANDHAVSQFVGFFLDSLRQLRKKRIGDIGDDQTDGVTFPADETACKKIGLVVELPRDFNNFFTGFRTDTGPVIECHGYRRRGDPGNPGDIFYRDFFYHMIFPGMRFPNLIPDIQRAGLVYRQ